MISLNKRILFRPLLRQIHTPILVPTSERGVGISDSVSNAGGRELAIEVTLATDILSLLKDELRTVGWGQADAGRNQSGGIALTGAWRAAPPSSAQVVRKILQPGPHALVIGEGHADPPRRPDRRSDVGRAHLGRAAPSEREFPTGTADQEQRSRRVRYTPISRHQSQWSGVSSVPGPRPRAPT
jgi:hypothetical protein